MPPESPRHFRAAAWPTSLKVVSLVATAMLCGACYVAYRAAPGDHGFTHAFGIGVALLPLAVLGGSLLFVVRGYTVDPTHLAVRRLVTSTQVSLIGLSGIAANPDACKGSVRVFGNGGLFSFTGWYHSKALGRYRMFATDRRSAVVLHLPDRVVVVTPAAPTEFIEHLVRIRPGLRVGET